MSNIIHLSKGANGNDLVAPLTEEQLDNLQACDLVNPKVGKHHGLKIPDDFNQLEAAKEVLKVRLEVLNGIYPEWLMKKYWPYNFEMPTYLPKAFEISNLSFDDPQGLALAVHMDDPLDLPLAMKKVLTNPRYGGTANVKGWHNNWKQFLETVVDANETITDYQKRYAHKAFEAKSYFLLGRPEEVLPELGVLLTAYPEGAPSHGEFPTGHNILAQSGFLGIHKSYNLSEDQIKDGLYTAYLFGQARVLAGVHYGMSGVASIILTGGFDKYIRKEVKEAYTL